MGYMHYCKANGVEWNRPVLRVEDYPVKIPTAHARVLLEPTEVVVITTFFVTF